MNTHSHTLSSPGAQPGISERLRHSKALLPTMAVLAVTVLALAAALVSSRLEAQHGSIEAAVVAPQTSAAVPARTLAPAAQAPAANGTQSTRVAATQPRAANPAPVKSAAAACANCGVVESVTTVQRQGRVDGIGNSEIGLGAIGGAVVGGILGNQVGGGSGKNVATVLGAAGGAYAGHQIEKNSKKVTVYQLRVRMADGSYRTVEQSTAIAAGTRVVLDGNVVRVAAQAG